MKKCKHFRKVTVLIKIGKNNLTYPEIQDYRKAYKLKRGPKIKMESTRQPVFPDQEDKLCKGTGICQTNI